MNVLSELQHDLQHERARAHHAAQQRQRANPEPMLQSAEEAGTHFENLEDHYRNLQPSSPLKTAAERYFYVVVAQCYNAAKHNKAKHTYSVAEEFARKYLPATVKEGLSRRDCRLNGKPSCTSRVSGSSWRPLVGALACCCSSQLNSRRSTRDGLKSRIGLHCSPALRRGIQT